jgi:hypothetical protein
MNNETSNRPLVLEMDDTKKALVQIINEAIQVKGIPCFLMEYILSEIATQVHNGAKDEREFARKQIQSKEGA